MFYVKNRKEFNILFVIIAILIAGFILSFLIRFLITSVNNLNESNTLQTLYQVANTTLALVDDLQRERGLSSTYLSDRGNFNYTRVKVQQQMTDRSHAAFASVISKSSNAYGLVNISIAIQLYKMLPHIRSLVNTKDPNLAQGVISYFSTINLEFLAGFSKIADVSTQQSTSQIFSAWSSFAFAQEYAGEERAQFSNFFGTGQYGSNYSVALANYNKGSAVVNAQSDYFSVFIAFSSPSEEQSFENWKKDNVTILTNSWRSMALNEGPRAKNLTKIVTAANWVGNLTTKINNLITISNQIGQDLLNEINSIQTTNRINLALDIIAAVCIVVAIAYLSVDVIRAIYEYFDFQKREKQLQNLGIAMKEGDQAPSSWE